MTAPVQIICGEVEDIEAVLGRSLNAPLSAAEIESAQSEIGVAIFRAKMAAAYCCKRWFEDDEDNVPIETAARRQLPQAIEALEVLEVAVAGMMRLAGERS